jgi:putative SOS response-associated peptidase YedK
MCGRFTVQVATSGVAAAFGVTETAASAGPSYNVAPGQKVPVILEEGGIRRMDAFRWGLVPSWAKDLSIGNRLINARAETLIEKPAFRKAFALRRCLVLSDGFYEWKVEGKTKRPFHITVGEGGVFAFAGLWERWNPPSGGDPLFSCAIVTVEANAFMAPLHARMPAILAPEEFGAWLDEENREPATLQRMLRPYAGPMRAVPVSTRVNSPRNDGPECLLPFGGDEGSDKTRGSEGPTNRGNGRSHPTLGFDP